MESILIRNGSLVSPANGFFREKMDIFIKHGKICKIAASLAGETAEHTVDADGLLVTPGLIDIHTHCYPKAFLGLAPDVLGIQRGATTILDAGSSGADTYEEFREDYIKKCRTKVFTLLNISKEGLLHGHELDAPEKADVKACLDIMSKYPDNIVGMKARASASVVGGMGLGPIAVAAHTAKSIGKPLMVHVGNYPPALAEVLNLLGENDIVTHAFHGKKGGILTETGGIIPEAQKARERGVKFDIGHGAASFSLSVFGQARQAGFGCDMIGTDLHVENYEGPVHSLASVLSKVIACGEPLEDAIAKCTSVPAKHFGLAGLGELREGAVADINIMAYVSCMEEAEDSIGDTVTLSRKLALDRTIYSRGENSEIFEHHIGNK